MRWIPLGYYWISCEVLGLMLLAFVAFLFVFFGLKPGNTAMWRERTKNATEDPRSVEKRRVKE